MKFKREISIIDVRVTKPVVSVTISEIMQVIFPPTQPLVMEFRQDIIVMKKDIMTSAQHKDKSISMVLVALEFLDPP